MPTNEEVEARVCSVPAVRFACITDPTRQHAFFCATATEAFDRMVAAYGREDDLTVTPFEFTEPKIVTETRAWVASVHHGGGHPPMVMIGSIENGQWVSWNLPTVPCPPVPSF
ncbi:hypothetical protein [Streptomyces sp. NEAU-S7GS2]|uniref:hypothetical protein n=1 Tax=Streptomyces sp. NEAU-S7GS2 TaxID=2202000 RepID=UPI000D6FA553|nr:hypothetical protein [Streptomyces sp. NEAU-S7GS2]AWN32613.1 hypothetical protein DKG71_42290 [Streptomyces sp. NEAU-S7GS2]